MGQQTAGPVGSRKGDSRDLLISQKPGGGWAPTGLRAEHITQGDQEPTGLQHHLPEQGPLVQVKLSPFLPG